MAQGKSKGKPKEKSKKDAIAGMTREQLEEKLRAWEESELADFITRQPESQFLIPLPGGIKLECLLRQLGSVHAKGELSLQAGKEKVIQHQLTS